MLFLSDKPSSAYMVSEGGFFFVVVVVVSEYSYFTSRLAYVI